MIASKMYFYIYFVENKGQFTYDPWVLQEVIASLAISPNANIEKMLADFTHLFKKEFYIGHDNVGIICQLWLLDWVMLFLTHFFSKIYVSLLINQLHVDFI